VKIQELAQLLLQDIGCTSLDLSANSNPENGRGLVTGDLLAVTAAINGGLQELWGKAPSELTERDDAEQLRPPTTVTITVTQYSKAVSGFTAYADWMQGCTLRMAGDAWDNEIVSATALLRPWQGPSGTLTATVYSDCIPLPSEFKNILAPVYVPNVISMPVLETREQFLLWGTGALGAMQNAYAYYWLQKPVGIPQVCTVQTRYDATLEGGVGLFLRVKPMPGQAYPITFTAKLDAPSIDVEDIGDAESDPAILIPSKWVESILYPLARQRFISHPSYDNPAGAQEIARQYKVALELMEEFKPKIVTSETRYGL